MKKSLNIFIFGIALVVAQACGTKSEKSSEAEVAKETPAENVVVLTVAEKRAKLEK